MPSTTGLHTETSRREFLLAGFGGACLAATSTLGGSTATAAAKPNILLLMADQFRGDCLGSEGHPAVRTPNLDRLAAQGARFRFAYASVPSCTPSRAGLLTGLSPWHHGMLGYGVSAEHYENEMPRLLREAGYYGIGIGKMHWNPQRNLHGFHQTVLDESGRVESPEFRSDYRKWFREQAPNLNPDATGIGWNEYQARAYALPEKLHPTHWTGSAAVDFLNSFHGTEPFFLKVSFARPHSPYDPPERFMRLYNGAKIPKASLGAWSERHAQRGVELPKDTWRGDLGPDQVRRSRQGYCGSITFVDEEIGRILKAVEHRGWLEKTLILFTADHGDMMGDHHLWRKTYAYEGSARIPLLVRWPDGLLKARRGKVLDQPVELRDVLPTLLDAAGVSFESQRFDGRSLLQLIQGRADGWRKYIDLEHDVCYSRENHWNALTDGKLKYIFHALNGEQQLFDLSSDPGEQEDLAGDPNHTGNLLLWRRRLIEHLAERGAPYVINDDLALRPESKLYSPHFPKPD